MCSWGPKEQGRATEPQEGLQVWEGEKDRVTLEHRLLKNPTYVKQE